MAGRSGSKRKAKAAPIVVAEIVAELVAAVERDGAVLRTRVGKKASGKELLLVFDGLVGAGLELGAKSVRRPLETQLLERLGEPGGSPLALRGLDKEVKGGTAREVTETAANLVERGRARFVARAKGLLLVRKDAPVLDARARQRLAVVVKEVAASLALANKKGAGVLRADLEETFKPFVDLSPPAARSASPPIGDVAALVDVHREGSGLTFVPKLVRLLGGASARDAIHAALLDGARAGRFELRPESGMGRLSVEDAWFCIPGPQGSHLSWVRRIEEAR